MDNILKTDFFRGCVYPAFTRNRSGNSDWCRVIDPCFSPCISTLFRVASATLFIRGILKEEETCTSEEEIDYAMYVVLVLGIAEILVNSVKSCYIKYNRYTKIRDFDYSTVPDLLKEELREKPRPEITKIQKAIRFIDYLILLGVAECPRLAELIFYILAATGLLKAEQLRTELSLGLTFAILQPFRIAGNAFNNYIEIRLQERLQAMKKETEEIKKSYNKFPADDNAAPSIKTAGKTIESWRDYCCCTIV